MCGVAGLIGPPIGSADELARTAAAMAGALRHRGPDSGGDFTSDRLAMVHRRLAVIDLSEAGHQPMTSRSGRWTVSYNGEIYNDRVLRSALGSSGHTFRGDSDTETLVEAIDHWGLVGALERSIGMFALAAWDEHAGRLFLARDRLGEKPLYWCNDAGSDQFAFASELRALRVVPGLSIDIDPSAVAALLRWSFIPHPHTIYGNVNQLAPGGLLEVDATQHVIEVKEQSWWNLAATVDDALDRPADNTLDTAADELELLLSASVEGCLNSDAPLGMFLSGGIDSSVIAVLAQRALPAGALQTLTVSMPSSPLDESEHAAAVARHIGSRHQMVDLSPAAAFDTVSSLATVWDEPFADPSMLPTALLCRVASEHFTVCLGGDGGDELFAGYNRHVLGGSIARRTSAVPARLRAAAAAALLAPPPSMVDSLGRAAARLAPNHVPPNLGDKVQKLGGMLRDPEDLWSSLAGIWPESSLGATPHQPATCSTRHHVDELEALMLTDTASVLPDNMLVKIDRASMAASLEVRSPFLDPRVVEWSWRQPRSLKANATTGKLVVRHLAGRLLPPDVSTRPKLGFDPPLAQWLRHELRPWANDLIVSSRAVREGWLDRGALDAVWAEHLSGRRNWEYRLWALLMLETWMDVHHPDSTRAEAR